VEIFCIQFHPTWLKDAADTDKTSFMPLIEVYLSLHRECTDKFVPVHAMTALGGGGEKLLRPALSLATDGGEWSASFFGRFTLSNHLIGGAIDPGTDLDVLEKGISLPLPRFEHWNIQPVT